MYSQTALLFTWLGILSSWLFGSLSANALSIGNQDLDRFFRTATNSSAIVEDRILQDTFNMAFLNYTDVDNKLVSFDDEQARYGEGKVFSVEGRLVHVTSAEDVNDDTACKSNILGTNGNPFPAEGWIALVQRGFCTFEVKVRNVYNKGAIGVIIYNDREATHLEKMQIKGTKRNITAVITYQHIGKHMAQIADFGVDMKAAIIKGGSLTRPINNLNRTSVLFVSISFIVLMVISLVWLIFYYIQRFRYLQNKDQQSRHLCSVTKKAIMKIPTKTGKSTDEKDMDSDCCAICIEAYKPSDCIRVLPCKHEFHKNCIDPWLIEHRTCPMCKLDVLKFYGYVFLGSEESILEYEADAPTGNDTTNVEPAARIGNEAIHDIIRSREFVVDFPRIFVLEAGGTTGTHADLFPARLPDRSQSSLNFSSDAASCFAATFSNRLGVQHGLRQVRKSSSDNNQLEDQCGANAKTRRSRSVDGRYASGHFGQKQQQQHGKRRQITLADVTSNTQASNSNNNRRLSALSALRDLTETVCGGGTVRKATNDNAKFSLSELSRRNSDVILQEMPLGTTTPPARSIMQANAVAPGVANIESGTAVAENSVSIQINGEDVQLN